MPKPSPEQSPRQQRRLRPVEPPIRTEWLVVLLAAAGLIISGYLGWVKIRGGTALFCESGGGCDIVQATRYATIFYVPTALWGTGFYVAVGLLAALGLTVRRWLWSFVLSTAGAGFSIYLTVISLFVIGAACPYCLASTGLALALVALLVWRRPAVASRRSPLRWSRVVPLGGLAAVVAMVGGAAVFASYPEETTGYEGELARHLARSKAAMYGAYWCPHCQEQKARFGAAARELPYVECDPRGTGARPDLCGLAGVRSYPTWIIGSQRHEGTLTLEELARMSGFTAPADAKSGG